MRPLVLPLVVCLACSPHIPDQSRIAALTQAAGSAGDASRSVSVHDVAWLTGCWRGRTGAGEVEETWSAPRGGSLLGMSRTLRGDSTTSYEVMLISVRDRQLVFDATPHGSGTTRFTAAEQGEQHVTFGNSMHDFPQRIGYRRAAPDSLIATIEGAPGQRRFTFGMERVPCLQQGAP